MFQLIQLIFKIILWVVNTHKYILLVSSQILLIFLMVLSLIFLPHFCHCCDSLVYQYCILKRSFLNTGQCFPTVGEWCRAGRDKTMEDKQINCCISGTSSAVQHNLGCLALGVGRDFSVQLIRSEFTSSIGISHPSISFWSFVVLLNLQLWRRAKVRLICGVSIESEQEKLGEWWLSTERTTQK